MTRTVYPGIPSPDSEKDRKIPFASYSYYLITDLYFLKAFSHRAVFWGT